MQCYESIPLIGEDNLPNAIAHLIKTGFSKQKHLHPRSNPTIWICLDAKGQAAKAIWASKHPYYGSWFSIDETRLMIKFQTILTP